MSRRSPEKSRPSIFWLLAGIVLPLLGLATRIEVQGRERLPARGAFVLSPNHFSEIDPVIIGAAVWKAGRAPRFLAKASLFKVPVVGALLRTSGQIPVERAGGQRGSVPMSSAQRLVEDELGVIVYPEGSLTRDPGMWPMRGKSGAVRLAIEHGIPLIPAAHWGTQDLLPRYAKKPRLFPRSHIRVRFGEPVDLSAYAGRLSEKSALDQATDDVMQAVTRLLEELRDEKAPAVRWDPKAQGQSETGRFEADQK